MGEANLAQAGKKQRILYFDALETLAIFLVVSVHNVWLRGTVASSVAIAFCQLAVPVFFMVHGALLLNKPFDMKRHLHRMAKTTLQLIAWMLIYFVISRCCGWSTGALSRNLIYQYFINGGVLNAGLGGSLWFMFALLQIYLLFPVLHRIWNSDQKIAYYAAIVLFVVSFVRKEASIWGSWLGNRLFGSAVDLNWWLGKLSPFGGYANCVFFFLSGAILADLLQRLAKKAISLKPDIYIYIYIYITAILLILAGILSTLLERKLQFDTIVYNWKPLSDQYLRFGTVLMAFGVFLLFSQIPFRENRVIQAISMHTIDIYYIHPIFGRIAYDLFPVSAYAGVFNNYVRAAVILALSYAVGLLLRKIPLIRKIL